MNPGSLMISKNRGIKWAVVMIIGTKKGKDFDSTQSHLIHNVNCRFEPRVSVIKEKLPISMKNGDKMPHRVKLGLVDETGWTQNIMALAIPWTVKEISVPRIIEHAGLVSFAGIVHPFEQGWVWKLPHPYAVVTNEEGEFKLTDVPPGIYKLRIWHEYLGEQFKMVTVGSGEVERLTVNYK